MHDSCSYYQVITILKYFNIVLNCRDLSIDINVQEKKEVFPYIQQNCIYVLVHRIQVLYNALQHVYESEIVVKLRKKVTKGRGIIK